MNHYGFYLKLVACNTCSYGERNGRCVDSKGKLNKSSLYYKFLKKSICIVDVPNVVEYMKDVLKEEA